MDFIVIGGTLMVLDSRDLHVEQLKPIKRTEYGKLLEEAGEKWVEYAQTTLQQIEKSQCDRPLLGEHPNVEEFVAAIIDLREFYGDDEDTIIRNCARVFRSVSVDSQIGLMSQLAYEYTNRDRTDIAISIVDSADSRDISSILQLSPEFSFHKARIFLGIAHSFARQGDDAKALSFVWRSNVARESYRDDETGVILNIPDARLDSLVNKVMNTIDGILH